jgi:hypothetical protein
MEQQPWNQREGGGHADDLDQAMTTDPCEVDGAALMMELMDQDLPSSDLLLDGDVDRRRWWRGGGGDGGR